MTLALFANRTRAGRLLAERLVHLKSARPLVLALPRGGVPVALEVARLLDAELDLLLVRKLGAPGHPELGIGAVVDGATPQLVLNEEAMALLQPDPDFVRREYERQLGELERRRRAYMGSRRPAPIAGRTVIIVDDGIATGGTMRAALQGARQSGPSRLVLAAPVAPRDTVEALRGECDELVVLALPEPFLAVGQHYRDFAQLGDGEVMAMLAEGAAFGRVGISE